MRVFTLIWFGQIISLLGSSLTNFALGVWVYQQTGSVSQFALILVCAKLPGILLSPLAGALVDRFNRRWAMIISDSGAGLTTGAIALLLATDQIELWHIYLATSISSICNTFQWPAYHAAISILVPKKHLGRANGMTQLGEGIAELIAPLLGGFLVTTIALQGIIAIDFVTFGFALTTLIITRFPKANSDRNRKTVRHSLTKSAIYGWTYIKQRSGLKALLIFFTIANFFVGIVEILFTPLVLSFASPIALGIILSSGGCGIMFGSILLSVWGGGQRQINAMMGFMLLSGLSILVMGLQPSIYLIAVTSFLTLFGLPIVDGSVKTILQKKVPPNLQGRVFALMKGLSDISLPLAYIVAAPLAENIFEPFMDSDNILASNVGQIIGLGKGRGIGLLFIVIGFLIMVITVAAYQHSRLRNVEIELPDN